MFELSQQFKVSPSKVIVLEADGQAIRRVRFKLERDFDEDVAAGMGSVGPKALKLVSDGSAKKVVMPIDAVHGEMKLAVDGKDYVTIPAADGFKATASAPKTPKNEDEKEGEPTLKLEFECSLTEDVWRFLGLKAGSTVIVTYHNRQLDLPLDGKAPASGEGEEKQTAALPAKGRRAKKARKVAANGNGHPPDVDHDEAQEAATPEEAEGNRDQRLREDRANDEGVWAEDKSHEGPLAF